MGTFMNNKKPIQKRKKRHITPYPWRKWYLATGAFFVSRFHAFLSLSLKKKLFMLSVVLSFLFFLGFQFVISSLSGSLRTQQAAQRWDQDNTAAQVSAFFSQNSGVSEDSIESFRHMVDAALVEASISVESDNPSARLWADAYSASGEVTLVSERSSGTYKAIGIGGDFFLFHPLQLLYGSYFSGNDEWKDTCVIDEDAAWQLFGSSNIHGKMVWIGGIPHTVVGVIRRESGSLKKAAGLTSSVVYVSYQTLTQLGRSNGINHYEIVMPNPVDGFAANYLSEQFGVAEDHMEIVENNSRFQFFKRLGVLHTFASRSMNGKAIIYPYWENIARGMENILALLTLFSLLFLSYPLICVIIWAFLWWRHKKWTLRTLCKFVKEKLERKLEQARIATAKSRR
ncbi:MAG: ABC transporter permease [Lachnospiraceae bacterium]|nr:ABC transporter permease [Lachnospiraceae bacterium]